MTDGSPVVPLSPAGDELASVIILCCNQLDFTRLCLESVLCHTRAPYELILVDNGSTDGTPAYLEDLRGRPGPERVVVIRNEANRGFPAGCNQGLAEARGEYLVLLNNDTIVTAGWLDGLVRLALHDWPHTGLAGAVTSYASGPQEIPVSYRSLEELDAFAARRRQEYAGRALEVDRLIGFCLLLRRDVVQAIGPLDEQFGLGFFDDDDLGVRARAAGYRLAVALDVFVHHFGSRTFLGLGVDCHRQLRDNFERFKAKWGEEQCRGYRLPEKEPRSKESQGGQVEERGPDARSGICQNSEGGAEFWQIPLREEGQVESPRMSLCMIVKDGGEHLAGCLASVADLVDEMIVVDTGSTDNSREIAVEAGARVVDFAWVDSFAEARNESLRHATGQWVFWLDADERLDEANRHKLRELFARLGDDNVCYSMRQYSALEASTAAAAQVDQIRLFPNHAGLCWRYRVHEQILLDLRRLGAACQTTDIVIDHAGYAEPARQQAKVERNLRLLLLDLQEHPDDAFILYNLGAVYLTQGRTAEALDYLGRSLKHCAAGDSLEHKLYVLLVRGRQDLGEAEEALALCRQGLALYPRDPELLFWEGILLRGQGLLAEAAACFRQVLEVPAGPNFTSRDAGLQSYRTRQQLGEALRLQGRAAEAEAQWRLALAECPGLAAVRQQLAELYLEQRRWPELEEAVRWLAREPRGLIAAAVLQGRAHLARREFEPARKLLELAASRAPGELAARLFLSHVLLQEGRDWAAAERALREVLALEPGHEQARQNLGVLLRQREAVGQGVESTAGCCERETIIQEGAGERGTRKRGARVSLCMIVKDEEANLPACLESVQDLVDEIIVVDTGSTDGTKEVAARFGARVVDFAWVDSFAEARNETLRHASGDWIFWMDADDRLDEDNRVRLHALFAGLAVDNVAFVMQCLCLPDPATGVATAVDHVRLFRNLPELRWSYRVHEQILPAVRRCRGEVRRTDVVIQHTGYQDPAMRARKLERDLHLLQLENAERPDDPFTLFNLGMVYQEMGKLGDAVPLFRRSLERSQPADSIVHKLYALLGQCLRQQGQKAEALAACTEGRRYYPDDVELLFQESLARLELGDARGAEECLLRLLRVPAGQALGSRDTGLAGYKARHNLAVIYQQQRRSAEAQAQWRGALAERPDFVPSWLGLAEELVVQSRWDEVEDIAQTLEPLADGEAAQLRARGLLARKEFRAAEDILRQRIAARPEELGPRVLLSHALLQEGRDWQGAEAALREVLALEPGHAQARHNLAVLLRQQGPAEGLVLPGG
jgi:glycosyltransferase involved in cell wall biosynthesis/Flp pilus assembly protein TadD